MTPSTRVNRPARWRCATVAGLAAAIVAATVLLVAAPERPDVPVIVARSVEAMRADWTAAPDYEYTERDTDEDGHTKTWDVLMIEGSPYYRLTAEDGQPLDAARAAREQRKLDQVTAARQRESAAARAQRIRKYDTSRQHDHFLIEQMASAFDFAYEGEREVDGREVYELKATPRAGYQPPEAEAKALTGMEGTLWIDTETFQWVKVTAHVVRSVSIYGFLARVNPGTEFLLEQRPVGDGVWMPSRFRMQSRSTILFFIPHRTQDDEAYFDYRRVPAASGARGR
ncbi:MAG: hypothetical protein KGN76_10880 [Acidobacteriota bacterium]|nr:hypothetical protein [Acidobacteriota bacterium]